MDRFDQEPPSIFSKPFDDDLDATRATASQPPMTQSPITRSDAPMPAAEGPRQHLPPPHDRPAMRAPTDRAGRTNQMVLIGGMGLVILVLAGFIGASLLGSSPTPAAVDASASPASSAEQTPEPSPASAEPTISPTPTPAPTPAGPPADVATAGWATVTTDDLAIFAAPGESAAYHLVRGAVVAVGEGPTTLDGVNWYRVTSLGGATGWASSGSKDDPYLETVARDPTLQACGQVRRAVFDIADGGPVANEVFRVGDFALPAGALDDITLAAAELARGMGDEICVTARLDASGMPVLSTEVNVQACGHAAIEGRLYRLVSTQDGDLPLAAQVMEPTLVHPTLLALGPADNRMSANIATMVRMLANEGTTGCINAGVTQRGDAVDANVYANAQQCSVVNLYDAFSLKLSPVTDGPEAWIKLRSSDFEAGRFTVGQTVMVSLDATSGEDQLWANAWPAGPCD